MNKILITLFSLIFATTFCTAQHSTEDNKSLLWQISGNGLEEPSYLFGTIHIICKNQFVWTDAMQNSIEQTEKICLEMDLDDPALMLQIAKLMTATDGKKLSDYFSESEYKMVKKYFMDSVGINLIMLNNMKPFVLATLFKPTGTDCDSTVSYEFIMTDYAKKEQVEIIGLETAEEQISIFESISIDTIINTVVEVAENGGMESQGDLKKLMDTYVSQDLPKLHEELLSSDLAGMDMNDFIYERNQNWIPKMKDYMSQHSIFFAVGAGHLWGKEGVIQLLKNEGYEVTPIK